MKLQNSILASAAAAALTFSISGAQAQYTTVPPLVSGSVTVLPYGGYYGPAITTSPAFSYGAPVYGYPSYDSYGFGYGDLGYYGNGYNPYAFTPLGDINGSTGDRTINPTEVQGGVTDPMEPNAVPNPNGTAVPNSPGVAPQPNNRVQRSPVVAQRAPYGRLAIAYRGNTNNVNSITMMLLDRQGRSLQQEVLTGPPAQAQLRVPAATRYYRVVVAYNDGTSRTFTYPVKVRQTK